LLSITGRQLSLEDFSLQHKDGTTRLEAAFTVLPGDPRYGDLVRRNKGHNRLVGQPEHIRLVASAQDVVVAVQEAVDHEKRLSVRSGGHCYETFVDEPEIQVVIDTALLTRVYYDPARHAFAVEAGATLGEVYRQLYFGWGVVLPGSGEHPHIGIGGHVPGGGYGALSRMYGLAADHLYAVEVVVVNAQGRAQLVIATREPDDPNRELWWAHTGGGGGNFGVVVRYWFRSPQSSSSRPDELLPRAPDSVRRFTCEWQWDDLDESSFSRLVQNYGRWCERNAHPGSPYSALSASLYLTARNAGALSLTGHAFPPADDRMVRDFLREVNDGLDIPTVYEQEDMSWLTFLDRSREETGVLASMRVKIKDAFLRRGLTDRQIATAYRHLSLTEPDAGLRVLLLALDTYGGQVNAVVPRDTASAQRDSVLKAMPLIVWQDPAEDHSRLRRIREFYWDLFDDSGGVPVPGAVADGAFINHPDVDLADPQWNLSGTPWHYLYYKDNYPRLQQVKARWDPRDVFRHALAVRLPDTIQHDWS
jgi:hypothetical protein